MTLKLMEQKNNQISTIMAIDSSIYSRRMAATDLNVAATHGILLADIHFGVRQNTEEWQ